MFISTETIVVFFPRSVLLTSVVSKKCSKFLLNFEIVVSGNKFSTPLETGFFGLNGKILLYENPISSSVFWVSQSYKSSLF